MQNWLIAKTSVIGSGHKAVDLPCQDSCFVSTSQDEQWVSLVVSDGAGSAKHSAESSKLVSEFFGKSLIDLSNELNSRAPGAWINDFVIEKIIDTRKQLRILANSDNLKDYHCTLVACLIGVTGGFLIHIGDGALFGGTYKDIDDVNNSISSEIVISEPENGEYANETFFITEGDWIKHLRITPIKPVDWIVLGTDGGTSIAMVSDKQPKPGVIIPLLKQLNSADDISKLDEILWNVLTDPRADKLTSDDKTLCFAFKPHKFDDTTEMEPFKDTTEINEVREPFGKKNKYNIFNFFGRR
jgi:hypothetical protein